MLERIVHSFIHFNMGQCLSIFQEDKCRDCNVPSSYYSSVEHRSRPSCRISHSGYHRFHGEFMD